MEIYIKTGSRQNWMIKPHLFLYIMIFYSIHFPGFSQQENLEKESQSKKEIRKSRDRYLTIGTGISYIEVMDNATSPLLYHGVQYANASLGYLVHSPNRIRHFDTEINFGWLRTRTKTPWGDPWNMSIRVALRYNNLYRLRPLLFNKVAWYLGPELNINGHFRVNNKYGNSAFTFDNYNGLGVATEFELPFSWKSRDIKIWFIRMHRRDRTLRLNWQLSTPVVSFMIRPTYVTITNFIVPELKEKITSDHIDGGLFVPFNLRSETSVYYILHNRNMLRLSYIWNFYHHNPGYNKVQSAYHGLIFSIIFKFNKNPDQ